MNTDMNRYSNNSRRNIAYGTSIVYLNGLFEGED